VHQVGRIGDQSEEEEFSRKESKRHGKRPCGSHVGVGRFDTGGGRLRKLILGRKMKTRGTGRTYQMGNTLKRKRKGGFVSIYKNLTGVVSRKTGHPS